MPTTPSRARRWIKDGKAIKRWSKLGVFYVQLTVDSSDTKTQPIVIGLDPGKLYSGVGVQSSKFTLLMLHLVLPFKTIKDRMEQRAMMRRGRRGRRINRKLPYIQRVTIVKKSF
ncbi:RRXRR domain-containing protein [Tolypothrix bouteillei VB521301_2]|uniref:RRXRR domain-containing protein n=1 Tax=Tolypothrix bouteillei TaxID=1246981 RepID=UPI0038B48C4B